MVFVSGGFPSFSVKQANFISVYEDYAKQSLQHFLIRNKVFLLVFLWWHVVPRRRILHAAFVFGSMTWRGTLLMMVFLFMFLAAATGAALCRTLRRHCWPLQQEIGRWSCDAIWAAGRAAVVGRSRSAGADYLRVIMRWRRWRHWGETRGTTRNTNIKNVCGLSLWN